MLYQTPKGNVEITRTAIASLVSQAAIKTYGVVGMATPTRASGIAATITRDPHRGVLLQYTDDQQLIIDLYVIIEYGTNIASVATSLINAVRYQVQSRTELIVQQINVHVQGVRLSTPGEVF